MYRRLSQRGFTLVELLVVIAVIGILATVALIAINPEKQLEKARDAQRKADLAKIQTALEQFHADHGFYPVQAQGGNCSFAVNDIKFDGTHCGTSLTSLEALLKPYLSTMPTDPLTSSAVSPGWYNVQYLYKANPNTDGVWDYNQCLFNADGTKAGCQGYVLEATLENEDDPDINNAYNDSILQDPHRNPGPNYKVTSP